MSSTTHRMRRAPPPRPPGGSRWRISSWQIAVEGIQSSQRTFDLAVIGGTGAYRNARGQVRVTLLSQNASRAIVSLTG